MNTPTADSVIVSRTSAVDSLQPLPEELLFQILSRLDMKSSARAACVCKYWSFMMKDSYLQRIRIKDRDPVPIKVEQFQKADHNSQVQVTLCPIFKCEITENNKVFDLSVSHPSSFNLRLQVCTCKGLVLVSLLPDGVSDDPLKLLLMNPETQEFHTVPAHSPVFPSVFEGIGIGFNPSMRIYLILVVFNRTLLNDNLIEYTERCAVIQYVGTDVWLEIEDAPSDPIIGEGVYVNGRLNWLTNDDDKNLRKMVEFNVQRLKFETLIWPEDTGKSFGLYQFDDQHLINLNCNLGLACYYSDAIKIKMELWMLKNQEWTLESNIYYSYPIEFMRLRISGFLNTDRDVVLSTQDGKLVVFCSKTGMLKEIDLLKKQDETEDADLSICRYIGMYCRDSCSIEGLQDVHVKLAEQNEVINAATSLADLKSDTCTPYHQTPDTEGSSSPARNTCLSKRDGDDDDNERSESIPSVFNDMISADSNSSSHSKN